MDDTCTISVFQWVLNGGHAMWTRTKRLLHMEATSVSCGPTAKRKWTGWAGAACGPGRYRYRRAGGQLAAVCCTRRRAPWSTAACAVVAAAEGGRVASRYPPPPRAPVGQPCGESGRALQRQRRVPMRGQRGVLGRSPARRAIPKRASACARAQGRFHSSRAAGQPARPRSRRLPASTQRIVLMRCPACTDPAVHA